MYCWNEEYDRNKLIRNNYISNLAVIHEKSLFSEIGLFSEDLNAVMDWEFWLRASLRCPFRHLDRATGEYRFSGRNITSRNRLLIDFHTILIGNYYMFYRGLLALARFHLSRGERDPAIFRFNDAKGDYDGYFRAGASSTALAELAIRFRDNAFLEKVARDFLEIDPRGCLGYVKKTKSARMCRAILPRVPGKLREALTNRIRRSGRNDARRETTDGGSSR
jgi:hypothetical protein